MDRPCSVRAILEVDPASQPISGSLMPADGEARPFTGWIELTGAIESMRSAGPRPDPGARTATDDASPPDIGAPR